MSPKLAKTFGPLYNKIRRDLFAKPGLYTHGQSIILYDAQCLHLHKITQTTNGKWVEPQVPKLSYDCLLT